MRDLFPGHYPPTGDELRRLWADCVFVFDANVLLDAHRYTRTSSKDLRGVLRKLAADGRAWIPYQVASEYHRNLRNVIDDQEAAVRGVRTELQRLRSSLGKWKTHRTIDIDALCDALTRAAEPFLAEDRQSEYSTQEVQGVLRDVAEIFKDRVGEAPAEHELAAAMVEARRRRDAKLPPGYKDESGGDYVVWRQLLEHASNAKERRNRIFVTRDQKEDWWLQSNGRTLGPRPELVEEFVRTTSGAQFYMYSTDQFLRHARDDIGALVSDGTVQEATERAAEAATVEVERDAWLPRTAYLLARQHLVRNYKDWHLVSHDDGTFDITNPNGDGEHRILAECIMCTGAQEIPRVIRRTNLLAQRVAERNATHGILIVVFAAGAEFDLHLAVPKVASIDLQTISSL